MKIPVVDFEKLHNDNITAHQNVKRAVQETGCFIIENTAITANHVTNVIAIYREFFKRPETEKTPFDMANTGSNRGWGRSCGEQVNPDTNPDYKQVFDVGAELPADHPMSHITYYAPNLWPDTIFRDVISAYYKKALHVSMKILSAIARAADLPDDFFADKFAPPMALLRANYYPPRPATAGDKDYGIAPHTDYGCLTLLAGDGVPGLEVETKDGSWIHITAQPGQFVINFGEMLETWLAGVIHATKHRVIGGEQERISVPFFLNPAFDTNIAPLGSGRTTKAGDYLTKRYDETYIHRQRTII